MSGSAPFERLEAALADRYRIERQLGEGGMATVYLAEDLRHQRRVAIKVLKPELAAVLGAERFLQEIKTTAALSHPHILPLFDSGEAGGFLYYVMPYVQGETIREKLNRETQFGIDEAVRIATEVADALDYAHRNGVIHRDIKPENILLHDGRPMVMDFGIALAVSAAAAGRMTETGMSLGTPHYMSPEQATADKAITARSDVYSLASVLYEMLAGEPPHTGGAAQAIIMKIIAERAQPVTELRGSVPANVAAALAKALEKLPADRFASAQGFAQALADSSFRHGAGVGAGGSGGAVSPGPWNRLTVGFATLAAVMTLALGWSLSRPEQEPRVVRQVLSKEGWAGPSADVSRLAALAPDGSSMILPLDGQLGLKLAGSADVTPIPDTEGARGVVYSPDGEWIAYTVGVELLKRPLLGGAPIGLAGGVARSSSNVAWLDDGTLLYQAADQRVVQIPEIGGAPVREIAVANYLLWMSALPGGRGALVVSVTRELRVVDLTEGTETPLLTGVIRAWHAPTGHVIYVRQDGAVFAQPFDLATLELRGGAIPLFDGVRTTTRVADMQLAPDGTVLYVEGRGSAGGMARLAVLDLAGNLRILPLGPRHFRPDLPGPGWSPDGESVVFESEGQIYTYNSVLNTTPRQITFGGQHDFPVYSPDGTRVASSSQPAGSDHFDLFVKDLTDDAPPRALITLEGNQVPLGWPSDTLMVFASLPLDGGSWALWTLDLSDPDAPEARPYLTSDVTLFSMTVSPDGRHAAYTSSESGQLEVYIRGFPDPRVQTVVSQGGGHSPFWSPDGRTLYYRTGEAPSWFGGSGQAGAMQRTTWVAARLRRSPDLSVVARDTLFAIPGLAAATLPTSFHPDGDRWIVAVPEPTAQDADGTAPRLILVTNFFEELRRRAAN